MGKLSIIAGCLECCGSTPCWRGNGATLAAHNHREATGHSTWMKVVERAVARQVELPEEKPVATVPPPPPAPPPADRRLSRRSMCLGKIGHRSAPAAQLAIDNCPFDKEFLNVYRCLYCGKWHVGHLIKPGTRR